MTLSIESKRKISQSRNLSYSIYQILRGTGLLQTRQAGKEDLACIP